MKEEQKNKFKTPEGYFESFNERLMARMAVEEAQKSDLIPKTDGFVVPDGYFDAVYESVNDRLSQNDRRGSRCALCRLARCGIAHADRALGQEPSARSRSRASSRCCWTWIQRPFRVGP